MLLMSKIILPFHKVSLLVRAVRDLFWVSKCVVADSQDKERVLKWLLQMHDNFGGVIVHWEREIRALSILDLTGEVSLCILSR